MKGGRILAFGAALAIAGCVKPPPPPPPPPPAPAPTPAPAPPPVLSGNWEDWPLSPGDWSYRRDARGSLALFGAPGAEADFVIRCDAGARRIYLSRAGAGTSRIAVRSTTGVASWPAAETGATPSYVAAAIAPADPNLDAVAFSRGRFLVQMTGARDLVLPTWAEIWRVVEDCRA